MSSFPMCYFNSTTLIAKTGNSYKGYKELPCIKIPTYTRTYIGDIDEGDGWSSKKLVTETYDRCFAIIEDNKVIGILINPLQEGYKNVIHPINYKYLHKEIKDFIILHNQLITT